MSGEDEFEGARLDYAGTMTYGDYLQLDALLDTLGGNDVDDDRAAA